MSYSPFVTPYDELPQTLPVFPLPGAIVMPGSDLPLNIFEPRYLNMVNDALSTHRMFGMIQPDPETAGDALCQTGCAGRITQYRETSDGRIEMVLSGVCRFDLDELLPSTRGYRVAVTDWSRFAGDYADQEDRLPGEHNRLIRILRSYFEIKGLDTDWDQVERLPTVRLLDSLSMALPFNDHDKQVLLEAVEPEERLLQFISLLSSELQADDTITRH